MATKDRTAVAAHLPNDLAAKLKAAAKKDHRTVSAMIVMLIDKALAKEKVNG